jgi:hypothetical protein
MLKRALVSGIAGLVIATGTLAASVEASSAKTIIIIGGKKHHHHHRHHHHHGHGKFVIFFG